MPYTPVGPFNNGSASPPINAGFLNGVETALGLTVYMAPAPTGNATTDQANLLPLIAASQTTGVPVQLQPGTYVGNFYGTQTFEQPIIIGAGKHLTYLKAAVTSAPVMKFRGGSGAVSGGRLEHLTLTPATGGGGIGVDFSGAGGVHVSDVRFQTGFSVCAQFHNELGNDFTEYCTVDDCDLYVPVGGNAIRYQVDNGIESFHGSGLRGGNVINVANGYTGSLILIGSTAFPYEAPLEFDVFPGSGTVTIVQNNSGARQANFYGTIRVEANVGGTLIGGGYPIWFAGTVHDLSSAGSSRLGAVDLVDRVTFNNSIVYASKRKKAFVTAVTNTTTGVMPVNASNGARLLDDNTSALAQITLFGTNYHYVYQLLLYQSTYNASGVVTTLGNPVAINNAGYGAPTLGWTNGLTVLNTNYPASGSGQINAFVEAIPFGFPINGNILAY